MFGVLVQLRRFRNGANAVGGSQAKPPGSPGAGATTSTTCAQEVNENKDREVAGFGRDLVIATARRGASCGKPGMPHKEKTLTGTAGTSVDGAAPVARCTPSLGIEAVTNV